MIPPFAALSKVGGVLALQWRVTHLCHETLFIATKRWLATRQ